MCRIGITIYESVSCVYLIFKHFLLMFVIATVITLDTVVFEITNMPSLSEKHGAVKKLFGFEKHFAQQNKLRFFSNISKIKTTELS